MISGGPHAPYNLAYHSWSALFVALYLEVGPNGCPDKRHNRRWRIQSRRVAILYIGQVRLLDNFGDCLRRNYSGCLSRAQNLKPALNRRSIQQIAVAQAEPQTCGRVTASQHGLLIS